MKFVVKNISGENATNLMRRVGYYYQGIDKEKSELIFIRPLEISGYPRFHLYIKESPESQELIFNLHLDQKRPIYKGVAAHAGEYEGKVVEQETQRIKQTLE